MPSTIVSIFNILFLSVTIFCWSPLTLRLRARVPAMFWNQRKVRFFLLKVLHIEVPTDHVPGPLVDGVRPGFCRPDVFGVGRSSGSQDTHTADTRKSPTLSFECYDTNFNNCRHCCCFVRSEWRSAVHSVVHFWILPWWIVGSGNKGLLPASQQLTRNRE